MKAREFAFGEILTESQLDVLRKLVYIYVNGKLNITACNITFGYENITLNNV